MTNDENDQFAGYRQPQLRVEMEKVAHLVAFAVVGRLGCSVQDSRGSVPLAVVLALLGDNRQIRDTAATISDVRSRRSF